MRTYLFLVLVLTLAACNNTTGDTAPRSEMKVVNIYSHRHYATDQELFNLFTARTGIQVQVIQAGDDELMARMESEGQRSPCDVLITADAGRLGLAKARGLLRSTSSAKLDANIPSHLRDPEGHWYGLTMRARVVAFHKDRVDPSKIGTYQDLTAPEWKGRVLVRSSENVYNQSLLAAMVAHDGPEATEAWARGIVANMARSPKGGDTDQLLAISEGLGDVAIVNSYYVGKVMVSEDAMQRKAATLLGVIFPTIGSHGTHVNISGGGVAKHAPHPDEALALLEFLSSPEAQERFASGNMEFPVSQGIPLAPELLAMGTFRADTLPLSALYSNNAEAVKRATAAGWR